MEKSIVELLKEIAKKKIDNYFGKNLDYTFYFDFVNEYLFIGLSNEDLTNVNLYTYIEYEDVSFIDLQFLEDYDEGMLQIIYELLLKVKECTK